MVNNTVNGKAMGLAFWSKAEEVVQLARTGRGIVIMPTGTGKTTQTPQALHEARFTSEGIIYVSVPKRILAVELASRVADEMNVPLGGLVGYQIRGEKKKGHQTRILFMTEGVLRGKIRSNPTLKGVSVILFDEFHQRTLMSDFNVALVERAQQEGSKVAFLLMSATIDPTYLANHFNCGVVDGSELATTFPITEHYVEPSGDLFKFAAEQVANMVVEGRNNGLVFMPGKAEIEQTIEALGRVGLSNHVTVLPLHGDLDGDARHAPFAERAGITVTVATDIVETGATLPNIGWVVDSGLAREKGYDPTSDISSLKIRGVARDRLKQRRGRCGRVQAGVYMGLFSKDNFNNRSDRTQPEIFRVPLREVVITIKALGLSRTGKSIRLIDNPEKANWQEAKKQLQLLGFVDATPEAGITESGKRAVELGCDPREAAMLLKAAELGCLREMAIAIAAQQSKQLLYRPKGDDGNWADIAHSAFKTSSTCDAWTSVRVIRSVEGRGSESLGVWCKRNFVSYRALQEVWQSAKQFINTMHDLGFETNSEWGSEEALRKAICAGLPDRVFQYNGRGDWYHRENDEACIARSSVVKYRSYSVPIVAWEMIQINSQRGPMNLITNAVTLD